jgi:hypothetical protein
MNKRYLVKLHGVSVGEIHLLRHGGRRDDARPVGVALAETGYDLKCFPGSSSSKRKPLPNACKA